MIRVLQWYMQLSSLVVEKFVMKPEKCSVCSSGLRALGCIAQAFKCRFRTVFSGFRVSSDHIGRATCVRANQEGS